MAIDDSPDHRPHPWRALAGLFEEAWQRERRRRYWYLLLLMLVGAVVLTVVLARGGNRDGAPSPAPIARQRLTTSVKSAYLPTAGGYDSLSVAGGELLAIGGANESYAKGVCTSAVVNPTTLRVSDVIHSGCGDPALYHGRMSTLSVASNLHTYSAGTGELRIATVDPRAPGGYTVGPVVMTFPAASDTYPTSAGGYGSDWIYDPVSGPHSRGTGQLLRISTRTGKVVQRWTLPSISRPLMVADADGLWLAPSWLSGRSGGDASPLSESLDLVVPGSSRVRAVRELGTGAEWMVASGDTIWLEQRTGRRFAVERFRLQGADARVVAHVRSASNLPQGGDLITGPSFFEGNASTGIYTLQISSRTADNIVWMNPDTLVPQTVATLQSPDVGSSDPDAVVYDGSLFVLSPSGPASSGATGAHVGSSEISRVTTAAAR